MHSNGSRTLPPQTGIRVERTLKEQQRRTSLLPRVSDDLTNDDRMIATRDRFQALTFERGHGTVNERDARVARLDRNTEELVFVGRCEPAAHRFLIVSENADPEILGVDEIRIIG